MKITLCDKGLTGDVPRYQFNDKDKGLDFIYEWLKTKDFQKSVFVCFSNLRDLPVDELRDEQNSILVSHSWDVITDMVESYFNVPNFKEIHFFIFEFENYQEAFKYCIDLRESY